MLPPGSCITTSVKVRKSRTSSSSSSPPRPPTLVQKQGWSKPLDPEIKPPPQLEVILSPHSLNGCPHPVVGRFRKERAGAAPSRVSNITPQRLEINCFTLSSVQGGWCETAP